ncbi:PREDICTED: uncharacterized protein LOC105363910 [Ceratosolen solmsi marchali]|uniref:Uncharacterized protein LOC105363910 n=1 Tax=Ceratosolen solmsi marchali TaxID=326594 RepID=A0AAJ6YL33_9HYME|nr:PREDICTED: uncharacterized protein LOC105363910 [Ceratosolen solmsi marchali]
MNPMKWKTRNLAYSGISLFMFYFLFFYKWTHYLIYEATIKHSKAEHVWEFVADFRNMMKLNPTIKQFNIIDDSGNYGEWQYSVEYTERFNYLPMIQNDAQAHFIVTSTKKNYVIESKHRTCFILRFNCLNTDSEFIFESHGEDTNYIEKLQYECPLLFSKLCHNEVMYQRQEIMKNLQTHFSTINELIKK